MTLFRASHRVAAARETGPPIMLDDEPMFLDDETLVVEDAAVVDTLAEGGDDDECIELSAQDVTFDAGPS